MLIRQLRSLKRRKKMPTWRLVLWLLKFSPPFEQSLHLVENTRKKWGYAQFLSVFQSCSQMYIFEERKDLEHGAGYEYIQLHYAHRKYLHGWYGFIACIPQHVCRYDSFSSPCFFYNPYISLLNSKNFWYSCLLLFLTCIQQKIRLFSLGQIRGNFLLHLWHCQWLCHNL